MKTKVLYSAIVYGFVFLCCNAQTQTTIYTPQGSAVRAYYQIPEMSKQVKEALSDSITLNYPLATELNVPSATNSYNCHGYAWHISEGGSNRWIGYYSHQKDDEDVYWEDASYIRVSSEAEAEKISYYEDNHSAIQTSTQGVYISKWGPWPLVQHARAYGPSIYQMDYRHYYAKPKISGTGNICYGTSQPFSVQDFVGVSYSWTCSSNLEISSGSTSSSISVNSLSSSTRAAGWVEVEINVASYNEIRTIRKDIWVGAPEAAYDHRIEYDGVWEDEFCPYDFFGFELLHDNPTYAVTNYDWIINNSSSISLSPCKDVYTQDEGYEVLYVEIENACGHSGEYEYGYIVTSSACEQGEGGEFDFNMFPNPAESFITVDLTDSKDIELDILINIADQQSRIVKTLSIKSNYITIPISDLLPGMYYVEVKAGMKSKTKTLIIGKK